MPTHVTSRLVLAFLVEMSPQAVVPNQNSFTLTQTTPLIDWVRTTACGNISTRCLFLGSALQSYY